MTGIKLQKAVKINLGKEFDNLERIRFELKWEADAKKLRDANARPNFDADAQAFICKTVPVNGVLVSQLISEEHFVFYNSKNHDFADGVNCCPEHAVVLSEDEQDGGGDGETIIVDLRKVHSEASEIVLTVSIHKAMQRKQNFGQLSGGGVDVYNDITGELIASFSFGQNEFTNETFLHVGSLFNSKRDGWEFEVFNQGTANMDLSDALIRFGGEVA